eukprot:COSAG02_NODE_156_length_33065_cov_17.208336_6_plen_57_part_00
MTGKMTGKCSTAVDSAKCFQHFSTLATVGKKKFLFTERHSQTTVHRWKAERETEPT